ncbi:aminotransferase class III [Mesotoga sp. SC_4PWA21]|nr:aminotransferase class III [Mesotoga sp. SC_4PWA21]
MLSNVYSPFPLEIRSAHGIRINTDKGEFIDTFSGIGVLAFGHTDEATIEAVSRKMARYSHTSNYFLDDDAERLSESLLKFVNSSGEVYFSNSGTEATEAAIKAVRKLKKGKLISFEGNFHGRTIGALSLTHSEILRRPFEPLLPDVLFLPKKAEAFAESVKENEIAAVFVESIQGNSGVYLYPSELIETIEVLRKEKGFLVVADEIQAGLCRTGEYFGYQNYGLEPDIVILGKAVGGGLPLGATVFRKLSPFSLGDHGSTFAPNPLSLAAGLSVLSRMNSALLESVRINGARLMQNLKSLPWARDVRGKGLMIGVTAENPNGVKSMAFERNVLLNVTGGNIRFLPALNIRSEEIDEITERLNFGG